MSETPDVPEVMRLPPGLPGPGPRTPLVIGLTMLAITVALVLFFLLVVLPAAGAAGAAGGCGGG
jgi:hypothetical protein